MQKLIIQNYFLQLTLRFRYDYTNTWWFTSNIANIAYALALHGTGYVTIVDRWRNLRNEIVVVKYDWLTLVSRGNNFEVLLQLTFPH